MKTYELAVASSEDRIAIYQMRHEVYALELGQHPHNFERRLSDGLDEENEYIVARSEGSVIGFVSITPPRASRYSIDKYIPREIFPFSFDDDVCEIRILTVCKSHRKIGTALLLMFAALRWAEEHHVLRIIAMGRSSLLSFYSRIGFQFLGKSISAGALEFETMTATTKEFRKHLEQDSGIGSVLARGLAKTDWRLPFPLSNTFFGCVHGGDSFKAIGEDFRTLERRERVICADVLDAWFSPAPSVLQSLRKDLPWLLRTSPPTEASGLIAAIASARGIPAANILPGAGSSDLIYCALPAWLDTKSRVLILDPMYGEYAHLCEQVVGCNVDRFVLEESNGFKFNESRFEEQIQYGYDLIVVVNPNNPTGTYIPANMLKRLLQLIPVSTKIWIDEAYLDYVPGSESLESVTVTSPNVVVCKSLSKVYALSGVRAAYLVGSEMMITQLRRWRPPWSVSLPAQLAAIESLKAQEYYSSRYLETEQLRQELACKIGDLQGVRVLSGLANFLLCKLLDGNLSLFLQSCRDQRLYLRDVSSMGWSGNGCLFRVSVKDRETNGRIVRIMEEVLESNSRTFIHQIS